MIKKQAGQAFILVLIVLAIGALLVVPALRLSGAALMNSPIVERQTKGLYAADAAQEYIMWKLLYDDLGAQFTADGQSAQYEFDVCGTPVAVTIFMRATEGRGGITLAADEVIQPTKTVEPSVGAGPYTYIIKLEQLSNNNSKGLDSLYDVLPKGLSYVPGTSQLRVDGGGWESFPNPSTYTTGGQNRLRWPASGFFISPMRNFDARQVKEIKFQATGSLQNNRTYYNWVLLNVEDIDTLSGPIAPITTGTGAIREGGLITVTKASEPNIIPPSVTTEINYTIIIKNLENQTDQITEIIDYLPPGFEYLGPASGITTIAPLQSLENINGVNRLKLRWTTAQFPGGNAISIASGATVTLAFKALASTDVSGTYYNEATAVNVFPIPGIFQPSDMTVTSEDFNTNYSWNSGVVIVPAYDTTSTSGGISINSNMALILGGVTITSWQVR